MSGRFGDAVRRPRRWSRARSGLYHQPDGPSTEAHAEGVDGSMAAPITPLHIGDVVRLKKTHPCGANEWEVTRLGMDIGLACRGCGRRVRLLRAEFDRRYRGHLSGGQPTG
jgi:hypothetical protein